jgi:subfamily B ATP-binding cassette protein HlyB/CyaB
MSKLTAIQCLAAIARHHGIGAQAQSIIHENAISAEEPSKKELVRVASSIGINAKVISASWDSMLEYKQVFPFMVRLKDGEYCIVAGLNKDGDGSIAVIRPNVSAVGVIELDRLTFLENWDGEVVLLKRDYKLTDEEQPFGFRWFIPEILKQKSAFRDIAVATIILNFLMLGSPIFTQLVIDKVMVHENLSTLWVLTVGILLVTVFESVFSYTRQHLLIAATNKIDIRLSRRVFARLLNLPIEYFERQTAGMVARQVQQIEQVRAFLTGSLFFTVLEGLSFFIFLPILFSYSVKLTMLVIAIALMMGVVMLVFLKPFTFRLERLAVAESTRQGMLVESIHGMRTIKSLAIEPKQKKLWDQRSANSVNLHFAVADLSLVAQTIAQGLQKISPIAIVVLGATEVIDHQMTLGGLIAFQMMSSRVMGPLVQIVSLINEYQQVAISVGMIGDVMNHPPERKSSFGLRPKLEGKIALESVTFRYPGSTVAALDRLDLTFEAGEMVGIVGKSGSGKTTLAKILQGLYANQEGIIRLDGVDLREIDLAYMRQNIGVVLQDNFMFRGTIRENISITKTDASMEDIVRAAREAGADEFIERMPNGYETMLEEGATNLSGGQRQRLGIARALITDPKILLLDEAASALDPDSEAIFMANLERISKGKTVVIISHRLSTLVKADKIVFFQEGRVLDMAPHDQLLKRCEPYAHLWKQQNGHIIQ